MGGKAAGILYKAFRIHFNSLGNFIFIGKSQGTVKESLKVISAATKLRSDYFLCLPVATKYGSQRNWIIQAADDWTAKFHA